MTWKLSTLEKKSCTQIEFWKKGDLVAQREIGWRWCWARYSEKPDLSDYDPDKHQIELYRSKQESELIAWPVAVADCRSTRT